jgi:hypothetical protein
MKTTLAKVVRMIGIACFVALGLWACLIHNTVILWEPPTARPEVYRTLNAQTSQAFTYAFMPSGKLVIVRTEGNQVCQWLGTVRGEYGHRVISRLWHTPTPRWEILNYKIVEQGYTPVAFEDEVEVRKGDLCDGLAAAGETVYFVAQFSLDVMRVSGMDLRRAQPKTAPRLKKSNRLCRIKLTSERQVRQ